MCGANGAFFGVFLQEIYGKKRPEKSEDYFSVSNSLFRTVPYIFMLEAYLFHTNKLEFIRIESKHVENGYM